jgi:hypothetical protein
MIAQHQSRSRLSAEHRTELDQLTAQAKKALRCANTADLLVPATQIRAG